MAHCLIAVVTDNLSYIPSYQAFERPPDNQTLYSLIPRGIRRFFLQDDVSLKPATDQIDLFITATLPENFAYIIKSFNFQINSDRAADWDAQIELRLSNHIPGQPLGMLEMLQQDLLLMVPGTGNPFRTTKEGSSTLSCFTGPMWAVHGGSITFRVQACNVNSNAMAASFVTTHVEFLEYELVQAQRYYVNTPIPVIGR